VHHLSKLTLTLITLVFLSACSTSSRTTSTFDGPKYSGPDFTKILVIGIADSYNSRAEFERLLASQIRSGGTEATAYYSRANKDDVIDRAAIERIVKDGGFDSVLITRVLDRSVESKSKTGSAEIKKTRKSGGAIDLFRYDYEELNKPVKQTVAVIVAFSSELFSIESGGLVWAIEAEIANEEGSAVLIDEAARVVSRELHKDGLTAK